eukprot:gene32512-40124_t
MGTIQSYESNPLKAEQSLEKYFKTSNPYLSPIIKLHNDLIKHHPNPSVALVGTKRDLEQLFLDAERPKIVMDLLILPIRLHVPEDIVEYVTNETRRKRPHEVCPTLKRYLDSVAHQNSARYVIVCASLHSRPKEGSPPPGDTESFMKIHLPNAKRNLGEMTSKAASRVLLEQTGITQFISEYNCMAMLLSPDQTDKTFVEEISEEPPELGEVVETAPSSAALAVDLTVSLFPRPSPLKIFPGVNNGSSPKSIGSSGSPISRILHAARAETDGNNNRRSTFSGVDSGANSDLLSVGSEKTDSGKFFGAMHSAVRKSVDAGNNNGSSVREFFSQAKIKNVEINASVHK